MTVGSGLGFYSKVEESGWLRHLQLLLLASVSVAEKMHFEASAVLICALAQIILDPYYRTVDGLAALIEKDWCSFGYKFQDRCGHGLESTVLAEERSPVFLQFLDALWQLLQQFPTSFEYNESLLLFLADHQHSALFGNFLCNCSKERMELGLVGSTQSIWAYVLQRKNEFSQKSGFEPFPHPLWPQLGQHMLRIWNRFWLRWDISAHPSRISGPQWEDD
eukprot:gene34666-44827_t